MVIEYYNPTPKKDREHYLQRRINLSQKINELQIEEGIEIMRKGEVIHYQGTTIICTKPEFLAFPLIEIGGEINFIRGAKLGLENKTGIKLRRANIK
ncbi:MAG: hypothetical protein QT05_C0050G0026 [archaeon GW2011_AR13]|nr:MAG: hypothetical protein QT05_C0050G0026 [archaeon GW2011_AR13]HIG95125.1 hypothetical protein [Nanoarchaeota archaeon]HIH63207.1 hypothetical protein [Nanoarchaeota archaeon]HIJ09311.1 hypothetical protein [Nanoarchaeota archaeon]